MAPAVTVPANDKPVSPLLLYNSLSTENGSSSDLIFPGYHFLTRHPSAILPLHLQSHYAVI